MKFLVRQSYDVHVCFDEPHGNKVIAFDVYHRWSLPKCRPGVLADDDFVVRMESNLCIDEDGLVDKGFLVKYSGGAEKLKVKFGQGRGAYRFRILGTGSGGNWHWEVIRFPWRLQPHVLNWLRRQSQFSKTEWRSDFEPVWHSRRALDEKALRAYGNGQIRAELKRQAAKCDCSVEQLIKLSSPQA